MYDKILKVIPFKKEIKNKITHRKKNKNKIIVSEEDFEFSDDSFDFTYMPTSSNDNNSNIDELEKYISNIKTKQDIEKLKKIKNYDKKLKQDLSYIILMSNCLEL